MSDPVTVVGPMRRPSFSGDMFDDLLPEGVELADWTVGRPCWTLTFVGTADGPALDEAQVFAVRSRMESTDDADQAARAVLRADLAAAVSAEFTAEGFATLQAAVVDALSYWLGD